MIFGTLAWTIELYITKYMIFGEIFSSGGATLYKKTSDQTVSGCQVKLSSVVFSNDID